MVFSLFFMFLSVWLPQQEIVQIPKTLLLNRNTNLTFAFVLKTLIFQNLSEKHGNRISKFMRSCKVSFGEKENTPKNSWQNFT
jgi:hypothetical protein